MATNNYNPDSNMARAGGMNHAHTEQGQAASHSARVSKMASEKQSFKTYYHVAGPAYEVGTDLMSFDLQWQLGFEPTWKWEEDQEGLDTDVVCLFDSLAEAQEFLQNFVPEGAIYQVTIPYGSGLKMTFVSEGYPAVYNRIPAEFISSSNSLEV